jgi:hypothetical protein
LPCPVPLPSETREDYAVRAHKATMAECPDPNARNQQVWAAIDQYFGDPERSRAEQFFPPEQFEHKRDVCLWFEHEIEVPGPNGPEVRRNDVERIKAIVRENNARIADTDAYSAIVDKHTKPNGERDPLPPRTIGFAGPYRIGMVGRVQPKFALFADEHRRKDEAATFRDRPRRSVEVLTLRANGRSYIDPIAALSEAPRLPLPVHYQPGEESGLVERYQADAVFADVERYEGEAAFPGGSNTFLPGSGRRKQQFGAVPDNNQNSETGSMALAPEDLNQIITALMSTPQMKFLEQMMQQGGQMPGGDPNGGMAAPAAPPTPGSQPGPAVSAEPKEPYIAPMLAAGAGMMAGSAMRNSAGHAMANRYSADSGEVELEIPEDEMTEQYAALAQSHSETLQEVAALRRIVADLKMKEADATRKMRIGQLASKYPHMVDSADLENRCLYSAGSTMTDDDFESHVEIVESYAAKAPGVSTSTPMVPRGEMPNSIPSETVEQARYAAELTDTMVEIYTASISTGKPMTEAEAWAAAREKVKK